MAFDGANIWVANKGGTTVTKLRARDGATLGTFPLGPAPTGVAFDGTNIWVSTFNNSSNVVKLSRNGTVLRTFTAGSLANGVAFDGSNVWVANYGSGNVTKLSRNGVVLGTFYVGSGPVGPGFWVANFYANKVTKLRASDGAVLAIFSAGGVWPQGVAFDGANIWVVNAGSNTVSKMLITVAGEIPRTLQSSVRKAAE